MKKSTIWLSLLFFSISSLIFSSGAALHYEIVPFDYADEAMREQICAMVADDTDIQNMTHETEASMRECLSAPDLKHNINYFVCRATDGSVKIYGYMAYVFSDVAYLCHDPAHIVASALWFNPDKPDFENIEPVADFLNYGFLDNFAVHKDYRGQGVAQAMLHYFEQDCRKHGKSLIALGVEPDNEKAKRAYRKFGFETHPVYPIAMVKNLEDNLVSAETSTKPGTIIILSGTSSAGKSSVVKELQKIYHDEFQVLTIDDFMRSHPEIEALSNASNDDEEDEIFERIVTDFYHHIKQMSQRGNKILIDTVQCLQSEWTRCHTILGSENVIQILDYCTLPVIISHVKKRNTSGDSLEKRSIRQAFDQFYDLYRLQESSDDQVVDHMHASRMKHALHQVDKERKQFDIEFPESIDKRAQKWQKFSHDFIDQFKLDEMKKINIACKYQYDFIVDTGVNTPQVAAHKIADYLETKN